MYNLFAEHYDRFIKDVSYETIANYVETVVKEYTEEKGILLDLACGTGSLSIQMAKRGFDVLGIDGSYDMLAIAREKAAEEEVDITFVCQQMERIDLYGTVDVCTCTLDSLNHIVDPKILQRALGRVSLFLHPDGVFIFDVNTLYKHRNILGNNCYIYEEDGVYCGWQNHTSSKDITTITLDFFVPEKDGYFRESEEFRERGYSMAELEEMLTAVGLEIHHIYHDYTFTPPQEDSQRLVYVVGKKKL